MVPVLNLSNFKKAWYYLRRNGLRSALCAAAERLEQSDQPDWRFEPPGPKELMRQRETKWEEPVTFSILIPAYETPQIYLKQLLDSLFCQTYPYWEAILADASPTQGVREALEDCGDSRIRYVKLPGNEGIAGNTNAALSYAAGDYTGLLDHDDMLTPDALYHMARAIEKGKKAGKRPLLLYSDEDKCDGEGTEFYDPHLKWDFNLDLLLSNNYICHFCVMDTEYMRKYKLRPEYDGAQDYDLILRTAAGILKERDEPGGPAVLGTRGEAYIVHVPRVLYHWRCHRASTAANPQSKAYAYEAGARALTDLTRSLRWQARVRETAHVGFYRLEYIPDLFSQRKDVGAVCRPLPKKRGRLVSGIYEADGSMRYEGLRFGYSGYMHRAALRQDVVWADERGLSLRPELSKQRQETEGSLETDGCDETHGSLQHPDPHGNMTLCCQRLTQDGYRIVWEPPIRTERGKRI